MSTPSPQNSIITVIDPGGEFSEPLRRELEAVRGTVRCVSSLAQLTGEIGLNTRLALCPDHMLPFMDSGTHVLLPGAKVIVWATENNRRTYELAAALEDVAGVVAWPSGEVSPRPWELVLAVRHVMGDAGPIDARDFLPEPYKFHEWSIRSTSDLSARTQELSEIAQKHGATRRAGTRIAGVAHEMFMNALYDAPVDREGNPLYAHQRQKVIEVTEAQQVNVTVVVDATSMFLQVRDPFGGLRRKHVFNSLLRGFRSADADARPEEFIDSSHGGAGLGMHRIWHGASSAVFEVRKRRVTAQTVFFDLRRTSKHSMGTPRSLQFWRS